MAGESDGSIADILSSSNIRKQSGAIESPFEAACVRVCLWNSRAVYFSQIIFLAGIPVRGLIFARRRAAMGFYAENGVCADANGRSIRLKVKRALRFSRWAAWGFAGAGWGLGWIVLPFAAVMEDGSAIAAPFARRFPRFCGRGCAAAADVQGETFGGFLRINE